MSFLIFFFFCHLSLSLMGFIFESPVKEIDVSIIETRFSDDIIRKTCQHNDVNICYLFLDVLRIFIRSNEGKWRWSFLTHVTFLFPFEGTFRHAFQEQWQQKYSKRNLLQKYLYTFWIKVITTNLCFLVHEWNYWDSTLTEVDIRIYALYREDFYSYIYW